MTRAELKSMAKQQIKGNIGILFAIVLLIGIISGLCACVPIVGAIAGFFIITPAFSLSTTIIYLALTAGKKPEVKDVFLGFNNFWSAFKVSFFTGLFSFLWALLFIIPGYIKFLSYSQAMYIIAENPEMGALEAINRSKVMMNGHKMDLFVLCLSFIGWCILATFTLGLLYIWLVPYMQATLVNFYNSIKHIDNTEETLAETIAE